MDSNGYFTAIKKLPFLTPTKMEGISVINHVINRCGKTKLFSRFVDLFYNISTDFQPILKAVFLALPSLPIGIIEFVILCIVLHFEKGFIK